MFLEKYFGPGTYGRRDEILVDFLQSVFANAQCGKKKYNVPSPCRFGILLVLSKYFGARLQNFGPETSSFVKSYFWRCPKLFPLAEMIL